MTSLVDNSTATSRGEFPVRARLPIESARCIVAGRRQVTTAEMNRLVHDAHEAGLAACVLLQLWKNHPDPSLANTALFFLFACVDKDFVEERPAQRQSGARPKISIENVR